MASQLSVAGVAKATNPSILVGPPEAVPFLNHFKSSSSPFNETLTADVGGPKRIKVDPAAAIPMGHTQNGAATLLSSGDSCLDFFFRVKQLCKPEQVRTCLEAAWAQDSLLALKLVFQVLAVRGTGKSDRESFYVAAMWLYKNHPRTLLANLPLVPEFGCFKDLLELLLMAVEGQDAAEQRRRAKEERAARLKNKGAIILKSWHMMASKENRYMQRKESGELTEESRAQRVAAEVAKMKLMSEEAAKLRRENRAKGAAHILVKYEQCERFRALHDAVGDVFADALRRDMAAVAQYRRRGGERGLPGSGKGEGETVSLSAGKSKSHECWRKRGGRPGPRLSLAAKWAPSLDLSYDRATLLAESIARRLFPRGRDLGDDVNDAVTETRFAYIVRERYRKEVLVPLREELELPEVYMGAGRWGELPYGRVASVCMKNQQKRFFGKEGDRFSEFLSDVMAGDAKVASGALLPHEILGEVEKGSKEGGKDTFPALVAELQWRSMVKGLQANGSLTGGIAVCDVSGSMSGVPMQVAVALSLLISELSAEPWNGHIITFSERPQIHRVKGATLAESAQFTKRMDFDLNTDFQAVFDGILARAREFQLAPEDMVRRLYVFSDMEFDAARGGDCKEDMAERSWATDHSEIVRKFREAGYEAPEIVFWNLSQWRSDSTPVAAQEPGAALVSGFSKNMVKVFLEKGELDPTATEEEVVQEEDERVDEVVGEKGKPEPMQGGEEVVRTRREFNPRAVMLKAVAGEEYSALQVVD